MGIMLLHIANEIEELEADFLDKPPLNFLQMLVCYYPKRNRLALSTNSCITTTHGSKLKPGKICIAHGAL